MIIILTLLFRINWRLTALLFVTMPLVSLTVKVFGQQVHTRFEKIQDFFAQITVRAQENFTGVHPRVLPPTGLLLGRRLPERHAAAPRRQQHASLLPRALPVRGRRDPYRARALLPTHGALGAERGRRSSVRVTQFIVGTGGDSLQQMPPAAQQPETVAAASNTAYGILRLQLREGGYDFDFVPAAGSPGHWRVWHGMKVFENGGGQLPVDEGSGSCHAAPPRPRRSA